MTTRRIIDADITDRADGKVPFWDSAAGTHVYDDPVAGSAVAARVTRNAALNITTTPTAISWDNEVRDDGGLWAVSPNPTRLTAPSDGWYLVGGSIDTANVSANYLSAFLRLDGTTAIQVDINVESEDALPKAAQGQTLIYLTAAQYVEFVAYAQATVALAVGASCNMWMMKVG